MRLQHPDESHKLKGSVYDVDTSTRVVSESSKSNISQLVMESDGTVNVPVYDWVAFFSGSKAIKGIKKQHKLFFPSITGMVQMRESIGAPLTEHRVYGEIPEGFPDVIPPPGLDAKRQWYLHDEIREFCDARLMDEVCPLPAVPKPRAPTPSRDEKPPKKGKRK